MIILCYIIKAGRVKVHALYQYGNIHCGSQDHIVIFSHVINNCSPVFFQPVFSDGLLITPSSPRSGKILHSEIHNKTLSFSWERFADPFLPDSSDIIEKYEWTIIISHGVDNTEQLFNWMNVSWDEINGNKTSAEVSHGLYVILPYFRPSTLLFFPIHLKIWAQFEFRIY